MDAQSPGRLTVYPTDRIDLERVCEEESALRKASHAEGAMGHNSSDYRHMWTLFMQIVERADSMNSDPNAFSTGTGFNEKTINAWTKMIATARSILEGLNKMRNADKMVGVILDKHTRTLAQAVTIDLGVELKRVLDSVDRGDDHSAIAFNIRKLMYKRLPEIFLRSARASLDSSREEFGLMH